MTSKLTKVSGRSVPDLTALATAAACLDAAHSSSHFPNAAFEIAELMNRNLLAMPETANSGLGSFRSNVQAPVARSASSGSGICEVGGRRAAQEGWSLCNQMRICAAQQKRHGAVKLELCLTAPLWQLNSNGFVTGSVPAASLVPRSSAPQQQC